MKPLILIATLFFFFGCDSNAPFDKEQATQEVLQLHHAQRDYHVNKKAEEFARLLSDDHISVNRGLISRPTYEENFQRFTNYFNSVEFIKWDDLVEPVIRFSDDGKLAYTIVDKEVILQYEGEGGEVLQDTTHFAWTAIYRKGEDGWKIEHVASTNE